MPSGIPLKRNHSENSQRKPSKSPGVKRTVPEQDTYNRTVNEAINTLIGENDDDLMELDEDTEVEEGAATEVEEKDEKRPKRIRVPNKRYL